MEIKSVEFTALNNLCTSCGVCKGICPTGAVEFKKSGGMYVPQIDSEKCVSCGLCVKVCPGLGVEYKPFETAEETVCGEALECFNAWSKDADIRHISASGGVVTTLIRSLLEKGVYDVAFCVDSYDYSEKLITAPYTKESFGCGNNGTSKSRYLPVSHEKLIGYIKNNRDKRVIIVATSCAAVAILRAVSQLRLDRNNYLLIGLFCDKVFNYNVHGYYEDKFADGKGIEKFHFKNKESGGWPGNMKFFLKDGTSFYKNKSEREGMKGYFMPERCLYCVDKLNAMADISLGDNYTGIDSSELGSNSVIIRTEIGKNAWEASKDALEFRKISIDDVCGAQYLKGRLDNLYFSDLRSAEISEGLDLNKGVPREDNKKIYTKAWKRALEKLNSGRVYDSSPEELARQIKKTETLSDPHSTVNILKRVIRLPRRIVRKIFR